MTGKRVHQVKTETLVTATDDPATSSDAFPGHEETAINQSQEVKPYPSAKISAWQTGITAVLQVTFIAIITLLLNSTREIAIDTDIRHPPTLGILHLRLKA
ncbi:hypothetical protein M422DRAFT_266700 [Sphaerobolus stellatus SS14]|uniref:Uncharacterized protein n=1 Tax=Sphaerobolus stellatus (strain SS14) TaxID=990650 RepID=A0A0C9V246_SPHS4|nr:hypothetical protein M422DRAFT_266700 [Sphaerobolus stellatus SS14]